ncbi:MAG: phosphatase PAP2 family protein [Candidatus Acidiferrales bacterium]
MARNRAIQTDFSASGNVCAPGSLAPRCSRIILGMHFLSDVVAGSLIGARLGFAFFHVFAIL